MTLASRPRSALATLSLLSLFAFGGSAHAAGSPAECRIAGIRSSVQCGVVHRALDPARPDGPSIDVHYVVVPALARRRLPDPVFLLAGGPGQSAIGLAAQLQPLFTRLNNRRDIVFVDQRGVGLSAPLLCADAKRESLAEQSEPDRQFRVLMQCKADLLKLPYIHAESDLGFFTTTIAMQDLDAVRAQLGAAQIDLVSVSYGTRAALEYMRQFPGRTRRAVLDSVAPPDMVLPASFSTDGQAALDALLSDCERKPVCQAAYPALRSQWKALLAGLPKTVDAVQPLEGRSERFLLTRDMVLGAVRSALYLPAYAAALPDAITEAAAGRYDALIGLGALMSSRRGIQLATGMHFSVVCAEDVPRLAQATDLPGADFGDASATIYRSVCEHWPHGSVPAAFYQVPATTTPTLLFSGGLDPATPPRHGARIAAALGPAAQHVVVPNAGHSVLSVGCFPDLLYRFINATDDHDATALDTSCIKSIPRPPVFIPISLPKATP